MAQSAIYDLLAAAPHEPEHVRFTGLEFDIYREGYYLALRKALEAVNLAGARYRLITKTRAVAAWRKRRARKA
jgi:hypothetical protein